jgi:hypothetical protein
VTDTSPGLEAEPSIDPGATRGRASDLFLLAVGAAGALLVAALEESRSLALGQLLVVAPLAAGALAWTQRHAVRAGARRLPPSLVAGEWLALLALVTLGLWRERLGIAGSDRVVAAMLFALLGLHLLAVLPRLRPLLGDTLPRQPPAPFLLLPLILYLAWIPWATAQRSLDGDEPWYLLITHSLVEDRDVDLADEYRDRSYGGFLDRDIEPQPNDPVGPDGELYSRHNILLPLLLAPGYRLAGKGGATATMALLAALVAWLFLRVAGRWRPESAAGALRAWAILAFTAPLLLFSHQLWTEVPAALFLLVAVEQIARLRSRDGLFGPTLLALAALLLLSLLKLRFGLIAGPVALLVAVEAFRRSPPGRRWLAVALPASLLLPALAVALLNLERFGNPLKMYGWQELALHREPLADMALRCWGLFWDGAFGLFAFAPLWLLLVPGALATLRERPRQSLLGLALFLPYLVMVCSRQEWYGGWSPPFRYGLVLLPILALLLIPALDWIRGSGRGLAVQVLLIATLLLTVVWMTEPGWTYNLAHGRTHWTDALSARTGLDFARFLPSAVRPRPATLAIPVLLLFGLLLGWRWPVRRARARAGTAAFVLAALVALVVAGARLLPTLRIDPEAPWVEVSGGETEPRPWVFDRLRFRESWVLPEGERMLARVEPGGARVTLVLHYRFIRNRPGPSRLVIAVGNERLGEVPLEEPEAWQRTTLGPVDWPVARSTLEVALPPPPAGAPQSGVALDRIELQWHPR